MDSRQPSYKALFSLYVISALILAGFGVVYVYAVNHTVDREAALAICLGLGVIVSLISWAKLEPFLSEALPVTVNSAIVISTSFEPGVISLEPVNADRRSTVSFLVGTARPLHRTAA